MTSPSSANGARTARRVPTTTSIVPDANPAPLVGPLAGAQARVEQGDPGVEVGPQPVDERQRQGDLGHEDEDRPAELQAGRDRLDVDRRLAAAGDPVEEQRRRVAVGERGAGSARPPRPAVRSGPTTRVVTRAGRPARPPSGRRGRSRTSTSTRPRRTRPARADVPWRAAELGAGDAARTIPASSSRRASLARPERPALGPVPAAQLGRRLPARRAVSPRPALVARSGGRRHQRPVEVDRTTGGEARAGAGPGRRDPRAPRSHGPPAGRRRAAEQVTVGSDKLRVGQVLAGLRPGRTSATSSSRSSMPGGSIARRTNAAGAR